MKKEKKGIQLAISTIILIILGIMILVGLLFLFMTQKEFFLDVLEGLSSKNNVDVVIGGCNNFVSSEQLYNYCCEIKKVKVGGDKSVLELTCEQLAERNFTNSRIEKLDCSETLCQG